MASARVAAEWRGVIVEARHVGGPEVEQGRMSLKAPLRVRKRLYAESQETLRDIEGVRLVHSVVTRRGYRECRAAYGRARCPCGYYALVWPAPEKVS